MNKIRLGIVGFGFMGHCDADMMATFDEIWWRWRTRIRIS